MNCLALDALQLNVMLLFIGVQITIMLLLEAFWAERMRRGFGSSRSVILPIYRKFMLMFAIICAVSWILITIREHVSHENLQTASNRSHAYETSTTILTHISRWVGFIAPSFVATVFAFVSTPSGGNDAIWRAKFVTAAMILIETMCWSTTLFTHVIWWPDIVVNSLLSLGLIMWLVWQFIKVMCGKKVVRFAGCILCVAWIPQLVLNGMFTIDFQLKTTLSTSCTFYTLLLLSALIYPWTLYIAFRVDSAYWRKLTTTQGFWKSQSKSMVQPLVEQFFPSRLILDYNAFTVVHELGAGAQASVFKVTYKQHETYAMKKYVLDRLTDGEVNNFLGEALILFKIPKHENVTSIRGVCVCPPYLCLLTELCDDSLFSYLTKQRKRGYVSCTLLDRIQFGLDVAQGMKHLHSQSPAIIHRDLKSMNVLLKYSSERGRFVAKVADMGCSRLFTTDSIQPKKMRASTRWLFQRPHANDRNSQSSMLMSSSTGCVGTVPWCAPEVLKSQKYTEKCDVFSMGVLLWELVTGREVNDGQRIFAFQCLAGFRLPLDGVPHDLATLISQCWDEDPHKRPSFDVIINVLQDMVVGQIEDQRMSLSLTNTTPARSSTCFSMDFKTMDSLMVDKHALAR